jgi:hypothetical protein
MKKAPYRPDRFSIDVGSGDDTEAEGNIVDHDYKIAWVDSRWPKCRSAGSACATRTESVLPAKTAGSSWP